MTKFIFIYTVITQKTYYLIKSRHMKAKSKIYKDLKLTGREYESKL